MELTEFDEFIADSVLLQLKREERDRQKEDPRRPLKRRAISRRPVKKKRKRSVPKTPCCSPVEGFITSGVYRGEPNPNNPSVYQ